MVTHVAKSENFKVMCEKAFLPVACYCKCSIVVHSDFAPLRMEQNVRTCMTQGYHFSGNLEMSGNSAKVWEKAQNQGMVREFV